MKFGGLYPKNPCPMLTIGCLGDAAAPSLTIVLPSIVREHHVINQRQPWREKEGGGVTVPTNIGRRYCRLQIGRKALPRQLDKESELGMTPYQTSCFLPATRAAGCGGLGAIVGVGFEYRRRQSLATCIDWARLQLRNWSCQLRDK